MTATIYHLAQLNIARMVAPLDDPVMADFVAQLDAINAIADNAAGFVWRLQSDEGDATSIRAFDDNFLLVNMSVWESIDALRQYTYQSDHAKLLRRRKEWFSKIIDSPTMVMWWVPAGHTPTVTEAKAKLEHLHQHGPTPHAFTFKQPFTIEAM